jgi:folylpolyglutamate synthase/dihydropteroate synthase
VVAEAGTLPEALALALARGAGARSVVIAGSLMLVGEARSLLLGAPTDPLVVTDPAP